MSLPWFPFHLDAYTGDTMHLTTEEHGAYLLLMIAYYRTGKPLPGYDRALAAICKLPLERWQVIKVGLAPFFREADGFWHHDRIDAELREASEKHAARIAQRSAAAEARWAPKKGENASRNPKRMRAASPPQSETEKPSEPDTARNAARMRPAMPPQSGEDAHIQEQEIVVVDARAGARAREVPDDPLNIDSPLGGLIPIERWNPPPIDPADTDLFHAFANDHMDRGTFSDDWPKLWNEYRTTQAVGKTRKPPRVRVELNKRPEPIPGITLKISEEAHDLARQIAVELDVVDLPFTYGMPREVQNWLTVWHPDTIMQTIREVMANRRHKGETKPPGSLRYFEKAIAQAHADIGRKLPTAAQSTTKADTHGRQSSKSVPAAAERLAAKLSALTGSGADDGRGEGAIAGGTVQEIGSGRSGHLHRLVGGGDGGLPADGAGSHLPPSEGTGDPIKLVAHSDGGA